MDGLLVVDKPAGPTSHDVVARVRRALRERRIGHTGTLDPRATGVLPLVIGRATRLARFFSSSDKRYRAVIHLGVRTDSGDADGEVIGNIYSGPLPTQDQVDDALSAFRGTFAQRPPAFSARKVAGRRSYELARSARAETPGSNSPARLGPSVGAADREPTAATVTAHTLTIVELAGCRLTLDVHCSAGFYIRALADDLGQRLGVGGHVEALRRTHSGGFSLDDAIPLDVAEADAASTARRVVPMDGLLPGLDAVRLTPDGLRAVAHGRDIGPVACAGVFPDVAENRTACPGDPVDPVDPVDGVGPVKPVAYVRLLDAAGRLVAIAEPAAPGLLHPSVVLM
jgi:tRNA pseudouridine55 synthase